VKARAHAYLTRMILRTDESLKVKDGLNFMEFVYRAPKGEKVSAFTSKNIDKFEEIGNKIVSENMAELQELVEDLVD
jgi:hypothetical protein